MSEQAKATAVRFFEEQDRLRGGPAADLCAEGYVAHIASLPPMDLDAHRQFAEAFYAGFPDLSHTIEEVIAEGDRVCVRFRLTGTNDGEFMGSAPTGRPIDVTALAMMTITSGKVAEVHGQFDQMGPMQQIGGLPGP